MAECNWCDEKAWFFQLNRDGLCKECEPTVSADIDEQKKVLAGVSDPDPSADWEAKVEHYDGIRRTLGTLLRYEGSGISTIDPPPSAALVDCGEARAQVILAAADAAVENGLTEAETAGEPASGTAKAEEVLAQVQNFQDLLGEPLPEFGDNNATVLVRLEKQVTDFIGADDG